MDRFQPLQSGDSRSKQTTLIRIKLRVSICRSSVPHYSADQVGIGFCRHIPVVAGTQYPPQRPDTPSASRRIVNRVYGKRAIIWEEYVEADDYLISRSGIGL